MKRFLSRLAPPMYREGAETARYDHENLPPNKLARFSKRDVFALTVRVESLTAAATAVLIGVAAAYFGWGVVNVLTVSAVAYAVGVLSPSLPVHPSWFNGIYRLLLAAAPFLILFRFEGLTVGAMFLAVALAGRSNIEGVGEISEITKFDATCNPEAVAEHAAALAERDEAIAELHQTSKSLSRRLR